LAMERSDILSRNRWITLLIVELIHAPRARSGRPLLVALVDKK